MASDKDKEKADKYDKLKIDIDVEIARLDADHAVMLENGTHPSFEEIRELDVLNWTKKKAK